MIRYSILNSKGWANIVKDNVKKLLYSDRFIIILGLIVVPILSFILITVSEESPLYTSISRIAWVHGKWFTTFVWALVVMGAVTWITYRMVFVGPLTERTKRIFLFCQSVNIVLVFIGCIIFPAKDGTDFVRLVNYLHDYLTIAAWAMYGIGLLAYSFMLRRYDSFLGFLGLGLMSFVILSSLFFISNVIDPSSYVGASAVSEVYIINSLFIYLVVMYVAEKLSFSGVRKAKDEGVENV
jgi:hypothetical protein